MKLILFIKPIVWLSLICYGLFTPPSALPKTTFLNIPHFDKIVHFGLFFVFCLLLFRPFKKVKLNHLIIAPMLSFILAALLEWTQEMVTSSRSSNIYDFLANTAGILGATIVFLFLVSGRKWEKYI